MSSAPKVSCADVQTSPLESYVVRVYRRNTAFRGRLCGTVEIVANGSEVGFTGLRELAQILVKRDAPHRLAPSLSAPTPGK